MPTYLCHGFRWKRQSIRFLILMNDIDDATPDWVVNPQGGAAILLQLHRSFDFIPDVPDDVQQPEDENRDALARCWWSSVKLLEEWDLKDQKACSRPYAYLADFAIRVEDEVDVGAAKKGYEGGTEGGDWFGRLRDGLQPEEDIGWYTVICEDEERAI